VFPQISVEVRIEMLLNFTDISPIQKSVEVEIPADLIRSESARVATEFGRQAKIPGFRPGKIPPAVVRTRFAKEIEEEVMNRLLPRTFREAIHEKGVEPVGDPHIEHLDPLIEGAPVKYKAKFEVKPQIELGEYRGLEVEEQKVEVTEHDVESMIERLREQASIYRPETERGLEEGDFAVIEMTSTPEGGEPKHDSGHFRLGDEAMPELQEALRGKKPGATAAFDKAYGEDAQNEQWRGKTVRHEVTLKEIRVQEKPEVTDDFAKSVGEWESVEAMREAIRADVLRHRELEALRTRRTQVGEKLLAAHTFEVPETMVEEELVKSLNNYARFLASQGVDLETANLDWRKLGEEFRPEAVKRVQRSLILEAIAKKEGLTVSDVEVDAEIRRAAREGNRDFAEVRHRMKHDGGYESLRESLMAEKALDFVLKEARTG
jgi:trigger factor